MGREHWVETSLGDLFELKYGKGLPKENRVDGKVKVFGSNGIVGQHNVCVTQGNTIIIGRKGSVGEVHLSKEGCWPIDTTYFIDFFPESIPSNYWYLFLKSLKLGQHEKSSAIPGISREDIYPLTIFFPPLNEQKRIVEKLDTILPKVKNAKARLENIPKILKKFRQSVLADACSGKLTEEWREGKELPEWEDKKFEDVGTLGRGRSKHRPRNDPKLFNGEYPFIQTGDVAQSKEYIVAHSQTLNEVGLAQSKMWPENTLCITIAANIANTAILSYPACFPDSVVGFINDKNQSELKFIKWVIDNIKNDLENYAPATAQKNINLGILNEVVFKCPPIEEQKEIVRRVEKLFAIANSLEEKYKTAIARVGKIEQSVLAKAFRGELVEPDPNDEPAEILLKRILDVRAKDFSPQRKTGKTKSE